MLSENSLSISFSSMKMHRNLSETDIRWTEIHLGCPFGWWCMWSSQGIPQRVDAMLIYGATMVHATQTYNIYMYIISMNMYQLLSCSLCWARTLFFKVWWIWQHLFHERISKMSAQWKCQLISPPSHPSAVPYVACGSLSIDDTKIIEEFVVSLCSRMQYNLIRSVFVYFRAMAVCSTHRTSKKENYPEGYYECARSLLQSISYGCIESESGWAPLLKQSRVCGRSVIFSLCNLDTGMTNTVL